MHYIALWKEDVEQVYTQAERERDRKAYIFDAPSAYGLEEDECLQPLKPLNGLSKSGDLLHALLDRHHRKNLALNPLSYDKALFVNYNCRNVFGVLIFYVDDLLRYGTT